MTCPDFFNVLGLEKVIGIKLPTIPLGLRR
jgi:hypothetical protein